MEGRGVEPREEDDPEVAHFGLWLVPRMIKPLHSPKSAVYPASAGLDMTPDSRNPTRRGPWTVSPVGAKRRRRPCLCRSIRNRTCGRPRPSSIGELPIASGLWQQQCERAALAQARLDSDLATV